MTQTCVSCAHPVSGNFCANCGAAVERSRTCRECSAELPAGARFCNMCGAAVATTETPGSAGGASGGAARPVPTAIGEPRRIRSRKPLVLAGLAAVVLLSLWLVPRFRVESTAATPAAAPAGDPAGDPRAVDLSAMTPREAADRLFDRIMRSAAAGDTAGAREFVPMALAAYERVPELDADARYHLSVLHLLVGEHAPALAEAERILAEHPDHLLALASAAQAHAAAGDTAAARALYRRFLDSYATEIARDLPEYEAHAPALPAMRAEAQAFLAQQ